MLDPAQVTRSRLIGLWFEAVELMSLVLLGCRVTGPATLSPAATRRAMRAAHGFRAGQSPRILACGGKAWAGVREADALCAFLAAEGVPERALEREVWSRSTRQNAHYAAKLLLPRGVFRVGVVTCDWHMPRALSCFRGAGFDALPLPAISPQVSVAETLVRQTRERVNLVVDNFVTRGFSRV
ncbi:MAG TPA: YdcF family protein [Polyangiaceae bacterium]|nr:YdcF family protein [Polyangiaceae bacterium]